MYKVHTDFAPKKFHDVSRFSMTIFLLNCCILWEKSKKEDYLIDAKFRNAGKKGTNLVKFRGKIGKVLRDFPSPLPPIFQVP